MTTATKTQPIDRIATPPNHRYPSEAKHQTRNHLTHTNHPLTRILSDQDQMKVQHLASPAVLNYHPHPHPHHLYHPNAQKETVYTLAP